MKHLLVISSIVVFSLLACKKDKGGDSGTADYMPMTAGSTWTYQPSQGAAYTLTATNRDTTALGKTFRVFTSTDGENRYRMKNGNEYYQLTVLPQIAPNGFVDLFLKDDQPVNATWKTTLPITVPNIPFPLTADLNYTIKKKDTSIVVDSKVFNNVIRVRLDVSVQTFGTLGGGDFYYANKVGLVQSTFQMDIPGQSITQSLILKSYSIK